MTWELEKLGSLCQIEIGKTPLRRNNKYWKNGKIPFLSISDMGDEKYITQTKEKITEKAVKEQNCRLVPADTVLMSFKLSIGVVGINKVPLFTNEAIAAFYIYSEKKLLKNYLYWVLQSVDYDIYVDRAAKGKTLNKSKLHNIKIPLPPVDEQKRIATILDQADALRRKREQSLSLLDDLMQAVFLEMFGDPVLNPNNWDQKELGEIVNNEDSKRIPVKLADRKKMQGEFPYYGASGIIDYVDDYLFEGESLLIAEDGANLISRTTPIAFIANGKYWVNNHAHVLRFSGLADLFYLEYFFKFIDLSPYLTGSAQPKLNQKNLNRIPILLPPLNLQLEFRERISLIHKQEIKMKRSQEMLDDLFLSLQQSAFSGHLNFPVEGKQQNHK